VSLKKNTTQSDNEKKFHCTSTVAKQRRYLPVHIGHQSEVHAVVLCRPTTWLGLSNHKARFSKVKYIWQ